MIKEAKDFSSKSSLQNSNSAQLMNIEIENVDMKNDISSPDAMDISSHEGKTKRSKCHS